MGTHILARIGYEAYGDASEWKDHEGKPMSEWRDLPADVREKWEVAAAAMEKAIRDER